MESPVDEARCSTRARALRRPAGPSTLLHVARASAPVEAYEMQHALRHDAIRPARRAGQADRRAIISISMPWHVCSGHSPPAVAFRHHRLRALVDRRRAVRPWPDRSSAAMYGQASHRRSCPSRSLLTLLFCAAPFPAACRRGAICPRRRAASHGSRRAIVGGLVLRGHNPTGPVEILAALVLMRPFVACPVDFMIRCDQPGLVVQPLALGEISTANRRRNIRFGPESDPGNVWHVYHPANNYGVCYHGTTTSLLVGQSRTGKQKRGRV